MTCPKCMGTLCLRKGSFVHMVGLPIYGSALWKRKLASVSNIKFDKKTRQNRSLRLLVVVQWYSRGNVGEAS